MEQTCKDSKRVKEDFESQEEQVRAIVKRLRALTDGNGIDQSSGSATSALQTVTTLVCAEIDKLKNSVVDLKESIHSEGKK